MPQRPGTPSSSLRRPDGYADLREYAVLGDGRTVALVARDGRIDWWPLPTMDAPPVFAAILDPDAGGYLSLSPAEPFTVERRYLPDTNLVETTFTTVGGTARVIDAITTGVEGQLPWNELVRQIQGVDGEVPMRWEVRPGDRFQSARPWAECRDGAVLLHLRDQNLGLRCFDVGDPQIEGGHQARGEFRTSPGSCGLLGITSTDNEPLFLPEREHLERRLTRTAERWRTWADQIVYDGPWCEEVRRSALELKLLYYTQSGAIAAAATTSLPERIGGPKNWDYRYTWIRDSSFTLDAFLSLGLNEEVHGAVSSLLQVLRRTAPELRVFYHLDGTPPGAEEILSAPGYRGSQPVRAGNDAATQTQLGTFGDLFDTVWRYAADGHVVDAPTGRLLADLADRCADMWQVRDAGIWELHDRQHYTISKMGCWVALDRAVRLAEANQIDGRHADRWRTERHDIKAWVEENAWSTTRKSYTFYAGTDRLDAAVLLAGRTGFDCGERLNSTVDAIREELCRGPLVYRFSGAEAEEGAFLTCSFWLADALLRLGRLDEAGEVLEGAIAAANDVGILSEQIDPQTDELLGNLPQALSHLSLINTVLDYAKAVHDAGSQHETRGPRQ
jgi:GH15 family glucan-1,4-alpha-glucosidase